MHGGVDEALMEIAESDGAGPQLKKDDPCEDNEMACFILRDAIEMYALKQRTHWPEGEGAPSTSLSAAVRQSPPVDLINFPFPHFALANLNYAIPRPNWLE